MNEVCRLIGRCRNSGQLPSFSQHQDQADPAEEQRHVKRSPEMGRCGRHKRPYRSTSIETNWCPTIVSPTVAAVPISGMAVNTVTT
jgi:hypothetical protein